MTISDPPERCDCGHTTPVKRKSHELQENLCACASIRAPPALHNKSNIAIYRGVRVLIDTAGVSHVSKTDDPLSQGTVGEQ